LVTKHFRIDHYPGFVDVVQLWLCRARVFNLFSERSADTRLLLDNIGHLSSCHFPKNTYFLKHCHSVVFTYGKKISEVSGITDSDTLTADDWQTLKETIELKLKLNNGDPVESERLKSGYGGIHRLSAISSRSRVKIGSKIDFATQRPPANCCGPCHDLLKLSD
jgi:hypothetical protein